MFSRQVARHVLTAALLALAYMAAAIALSRFASPSVFIFVLYPGMLLAEGLILMLPESADGALVAYAGDGLLLFACMSVAFALLFWWACAFAAIGLRVRWLNRAMW